MTTKEKILLNLLEELLSAAEDAVKDYYRNMADRESGEMEYLDQTRRSINNMLPEILK